MNNTYPTNTQLERLTHIMAVDLYPKMDGSLHSENLPNWNPNQTNDWLQNLVNSAHDNGVQVSIVISHDETTYNNFASVTANKTKRDTLVAQIARFVKNRNLDGVYIDC